MSRIASYEAEIKMPPPPPATNIVTNQANIAGEICRDIIRLALEKVAREHSGSITQSYYDNAGVVHNVYLAVHPAKFPSGVGVQIEKTGNVTFHYDSYAGNAVEAQKICQEIKQSYIVFALLRSLHQMGFNVQTKIRQISEDEQTVLINASKLGGKGVDVLVDKRGSLEADFKGYTDQSCLSDEANLRKKLQDQAVEIKVDHMKQKSWDSVPEKGSSTIK